MSFTINCTSKYMLLLLILLSSLSDSSHCRTLRDPQADLMKYLKNNITNYSPEIRPNLDPNQVVNVSMSALVSHIVAVDSAKQSVKISAYVEASWPEERLVWDPADFDNVTVMDWNSEQLWIPVILVYNGIGDNQLLKPQIPSYITSISPNLSMVTASWRQEWGFACEFDVRRFPIDRHTCDIEFFLSDQGRQGLVAPVKASSNNNELAAYIANSEWRMLNASTFVRRRTYELLNDSPPIPMPTFVISMAIERVSTYYMLNVVTPLLLLTLLQVLVFFVPVESGEKLGFGITIMLSYTVFLLLLDGILPKSQSMPAIAAFITAAMTLSTTSLLLTSIIIRFHFTPDGVQMPAACRAVFVGCLGRLLCVRGADRLWKSDQDALTTADAADSKKTQKPDQESDWVVAAHAVERLLVVVGMLATGVIFGVFLIEPFVQV